MNELKKHLLDIAFPEDRRMGYYKRYIIRFWIFTGILVLSGVTALILWFL